MNTRLLLEAINCREAIVTRELILKLKNLNVSNYSGILIKRAMQEYLDTKNIWLLEIVIETESMNAECLNCDKCKASLNDDDDECLNCDKCKVSFDGVMEAICAHGTSTLFAKFLALKKDKNIALFVSRALLQMLSNLKDSDYKNNHMKTARYNELLKYILGLLDSLQTEIPENDKYYFNSNIRQCISLAIENKIYYAICTFCKINDRDTLQSISWLLNSSIKRVTKILKYFQEKIHLNEDIVYNTIECYNEKYNNYSSIEIKALLKTICKLCPSLTWCHCQKKGFYLTYLSLEDLKTRKYYERILANQKQHRILMLESCLAISRLELSGTDPSNLIQISQIQSKMMIYKLDLDMLIN